MVRQKRFIDSSDMVRNYVTEQTDLKPTRLEIQRVMKDHLNMSFKKVVKGPIHLNSDRNRILR